MKAKHLLLTATFLTASVAAGAQTTYSQRHHVAARKGDQQARIAQGERNGQLTHHEAAKLEHQEHGINREERGMRAQDGGHLTAQDRHTLARQQNQESRRIYNQKHDAQVRPGTVPR